MLKWRSEIKQFVSKVCSLFFLSFHIFLKLKNHWYTVLWCFQIHNMVVQYSPILQVLTPPPPLQSLFINIVRCYNYNCLLCAVLPRHDLPVLWLRIIMPLNPLLKICSLKLYANCFPMIQSNDDRDQWTPQDMSCPGVRVL